jgi:hypothetical protein
MLCPLLIPAELEVIAGAIASIGSAMAGAGLTVMVTTVVNKEN